jgi:uncharacterized membrane protein
MVDIWIGSFYRILNSFGFPDPVHVTLVHIPMGLVIGAFFFAWLAALTPRKKLAITAYHCITLAFIFLFPVIISGFMDWRNFYLGAWLAPIKMKMVLAVILLLLSGTAVIMGFRGRESSRIILAFYSICLLAVIGLGWFGGRLVYGEKVMEISKNYQVGEKIFMANCNICHANGGNKITPEQPLRNSDDLENFKTFLALIRNPEKLMPPFTASQISDKEVSALYDYIVNEINCPPGTVKSSR